MHDQKNIAIQYKVNFGFFINESWFYSSKKHGLLDKSFGFS